MFRDGIAFYKINEDGSVVLTSQKADNLYFSTLEIPRQQILFNPDYVMFSNFRYSNEKGRIFVIDKATGNISFFDIAFSNSNRIQSGTCISLGNNNLLLAVSTSVFDNQCQIYYYVVEANGKISQVYEKNVATGGDYLRLSTFYYDQPSNSIGLTYCSALGGYRDIFSRSNGAHLRNEQTDRNVEYPILQFKDKAFSYLNSSVYEFDTSTGKLTEILYEQPYFSKPAELLGVTEYGIKWNTVSPAVSKISPYQIGYGCYTVLNPRTNTLHGLFLCKNAELSVLIK